MKTKIELPQHKPKKMISAEIEIELLKAVKIELKRRKISLREAVEYGLRVFIDSVSK